MTRSRPTRLVVPALLVVVTATAACSSLLPRGLTAPAPLPAAPERTAELTPPPAPAVVPPELPPGLLAAGATLSLVEVVDVALRNNPTTRQSYFAVLAAAAELASVRAAYYPRLDLTVEAASAARDGVDRHLDPTVTAYGPALDLGWLVYDLGGRAADAEAARLAVLTADWAHTAAVQDVVLAVQRTFVEYVNAKARREAAQSNLAEAETVLTAANVRHDAGVATIAEVLQARTARSQAQLELDTLNGVVLVLRGALATAMGLPASLPYDVGDLPAELPLDTATQAVEQLIEAARTRRPELAAARLAAERAGVRVGSFRAEGLPSLHAAASAGRVWSNAAGVADPADGWSARLFLNVPLFTGFETRANIAKAEAEAQLAVARAASLEQEVVLEVWTSATALATASQVVRTATDLLASAEQSEQVALGRYREGVGTIIDLLAAQAALADARAQHITARAAWFLALAQLARDTGAASPNLATALDVVAAETTP